MTIDLKKYIGWPLEAVSVEMDLFTVALVRHALTLAEAADLANQRARARIIFVADKVVLSNVQGGAAISEIEQTSDGRGNLRYVFWFGSDAFMDVTASDIVDLQF